MAQYKIALKHAAVSIPGVGVLSGERILEGAEYEKYVGLGLLEPYFPVATPPQPKVAPQAPVAPPAPVLTEELPTGNVVQEGSEEPPEPVEAKKKPSTRR